jgi:hypothetical protein
VRNLTDATSPLVLDSELLPGLAANSFGLPFLFVRIHVNVIRRDKLVPFMGAGRACPKGHQAFYMPSENTAALH